MYCRDRVLRTVVIRVLVMSFTRPTVRGMHCVQWDNVLVDTWFLCWVFLKMVAIVVSKVQSDAGENLSGCSMV